MIPESLKGTLAAAVRKYGLYPRLDVVRAVVPVSNLPSALEGFCIAHLSDLHVGEGAWVPPVLPEVAAVLARERPDLVVNTGDFVIGKPPIDQVSRSIRPLAEAVPGVPHVAVLGNHDYYLDDARIAELSAMLSGFGIQILHNRSVAVERSGEKLFVVGLSQEFGESESGIAALLGGSRPRILIIHQVESMESVPHGAADLALAGHTHGGQVTPPPLAPLVVRYLNGSRYVQGWYRVNEIPTYINRGLGATGLPIRFGARPEVTFFRLTTGGEGSTPR